MNTLKIILISILGLIVLTAIGFYSGFVGNIYDSTIGRQQMDVQRENFEHNKSYVHGKIDDLAKYKREYERATTKDEKQQVRNIILDDFANFDSKMIDNLDLYNFLKDMESGS